MDRKILIDQVLAILEVWVVRDKEYDKLNDQLRKFNEIPTHLNLMDDQLHAPLYQLFDEIFGETDLTGYFLYEQPHAACNWNGKEWPLQTINQLREYVYHLNGIEKEMEG